MPRLILSLGSGGQTASVQTLAMNVPAVQDAVQAAQANAVIVSVPELTREVRQELGDLSGVEAVYDDLQGQPLVADEQEVEDFLKRVRDLRGEDNAPVPIETVPLRADGGGPAVLPAPSNETRIQATADGPIESVDDSMAYAGVPSLHDQGLRGEGIISVIVDTGMCRSAIRSERHLEGADLTGEDDPWSQLSDHGGMAGGIMAGDETTPGITTGYLPASDVFPIKTTLASSELIQAQDIIISLAEDTGNVVVVNNSWGFRECEGICDHPITTAVANAADKSNIVQVFAAGNSASGISGCGTACDGSTPGISGPNSLSNVITVGASGRNGKPDDIQEYSSRGGSGRVACGSNKPDITAPIFGIVPYGCSERDIGNGGGTSAACPQVAGAAGLLVDSGVAPGRVASHLQSGAVQFGSDGFNGCSGAGNLDVEDAVMQTPSLPTPSVSSTASVASIGVTIGVLGAIIRRAVD